MKTRLKIAKTSISHDVIDGNLKKYVFWLSK